MTKERIEELLRYYTTSLDILKKLLEQDESVNKEHSDKANLSISLFSDTIECLNLLQSKMVED